MTKDISTKFGIDKCGVLAMKRGRETECDGIELENGEEIGQVGEGGYKYLGILEKGGICQEEMKENKVWNTNAVVIPVVIGALGTIPKRINQNIKQTDIPVDIISI